MLILKQVSFALFSFLERSIFSLILKQKFSTTKSSPMKVLLYTSARQLQQVMFAICKVCSWLYCRVLFFFCRNGDHYIHESDLGGQDTNAVGIRDANEGGSMHTTVIQIGWSQGLLQRAFGFICRFVWECVGFVALFSVHSCIV